MDEVEWLTCTDPGPMLDYLQGRASDRKFRLFAVACCRRIGHLLEDPRCQEALEVFDGYANGICSGAALREARRNAEAAFDPYNSCRLNEQRVWSGAPWVQFYARGAVRAAGRSDVWEAARQARMTAASATSIGASMPGDEARRGEEARQSDLLRDIIGNPFRPVSLDPAWLSGTVRNLAEVIYEERAFDRLPILADALEEAGCGDAEILAHCRGPEPHTRGCWVIDLFLGKS